MLAIAEMKFTIQQSKLSGFERPSQKYICFKSRALIVYVNQDIPITHYLVDIQTPTTELSLQNCFTL